MKYEFDWKSIVGGLVFFLVGSIQLSGILQARSWLEKDAIMDKAEIVTQRSSSGTNFRLEVSYRWEHEGNAYAGHEFSMEGTLVEESRSVLEDKASRWLHNKNVKCRMNPHKPGQAVLVPDRNLDSQIVFIVSGILLLLWGAAWPMWLARRSLSENTHMLFPAEGYVMAAVALILGGIMSYLIYGELSDRQEHLKWKETPCTVLESRVAWFNGESRPLIRYSWVLNERKYEGQETSGSLWHGSVLEVEKLVGRFPAGKQTVCWVNPGMPVQAVLERDPPLRGWLWWAAIASLIGFCSWRFVFCWKQWRAARIGIRSGGETDLLQIETDPSLAVINQKKAFMREAFLNFLAELTLVRGLFLILLPCLAVMIWLLPIASHEFEHGLLLTHAQVGCIFICSILMSGLAAMAKRIWKS